MTIFFIEYDSVFLYIFKVSQIKNICIFTFNYVYINLKYICINILLYNYLQMLFTLSVYIYIIHSIETISSDQKCKTVVYL